ncbi:MAG: protease inhibitor I42 family protein [Eubacteriales bacterium]|nr:protease inhibitor I42 family protein [Eubacteriales bacterium]
MKKTGLVFLAALIFTALFFGGCMLKIDNGEASFQLGDESSGLGTVPTELTVADGSTFSINLETDAGCSWRASVDDETVAVLLSNEYAAEDTDKPGSGGVATLTFSALKKGETEVALVCTEDSGGKDTDKTLTLTIIVE